jgi:hypothetical protein
MQELTLARTSGNNIGAYHATGPPLHFLQFRFASRCPRIEQVVKDAVEIFRYGNWTEPRNIISRQFRSTGVSAAANRQPSVAARCKDSRVKAGANRHIPTEAGLGHQGIR